MNLAGAKSDQVFGHEEVKNFFLTNFRSGRLHHSWLIHGESGIGKATLVYQFAKFLLQHPLYTPSDLEVNTSNSAIKKIEAQSHPDLVVIDAEYKDGELRKQALISVEEIREVNKFLRLTPCESNYRVVIIDGADHMNISAANAILKILEEPPKNAVLFLIASSIFKILPTIRSRCITWRLKALSFPQFFQALPNISEDDAQKLYALTHGNLKLAVNIYEKKLISWAEELNKALSNKSLSVALKFIESINPDQENWQLTKCLILNSAIEEIKSLATKPEVDLEPKLKRFFQLQHEFHQAEIFHLDKQHLILNTLM